MRNGAVDSIPRFQNKTKFIIMAKSGDKRRLEENKAHVQRIKTAIVITNAIFIIARFIIFRASVTKLHYTCTAITTLLYYISFGSLSNALGRRFRCLHYHQITALHHHHIYLHHLAAPYYAPTGELLFSGVDLKDGSLEYYHDIIYISIFTQIVALTTDYAWFILLLIPGYAIVKITVSLIIPRMKASDPIDIPETESEKKRREKKERQMARRQRMMS